jgi:hypothetical protein
MITKKAQGVFKWMPLSYANRDDALADQVGGKWDEGHLKLVFLFACSEEKLRGNFFICFGRVNLDQERFQTIASE